jgi:type IV secretory pathway VirB10-like protein
MFFRIVAIALLMNVAAYAQSLGDVARENREMQNAQNPSSTTKPKVITNADLPHDPNKNQAPGAAQPAANGKLADHRPSAYRAEDRRFAEQRFAEQRAAEQRAAAQWKRQILVQKNKVTTLQAQIDQIHGSIRSANGGVQAQGPFNRYQARQLLRAAQIQQQLNQQQRKLDRMQDAARHAGMHTVVYDP